jgi:large subunit ribosomal protein L20
VWRGPYAVERRKLLWKQYVAHVKNRRTSRSFKLARQHAMRIFKSQYANRRILKRNMKRNWMLRMHNNFKLHGLTYSRAKALLYRKNIYLNRKILSNIGVYDRAVFTNIVDAADIDWKTIKAEKEAKEEGVKWTMKEADDMVIKYIETNIAPEIYTDPNIRFNRKVTRTEDDPKGFQVKYTVDYGPQSYWQKILPRNPELQNFNYPEHWRTDLNFAEREIELLPFDLLQKSQDPSSEIVDPDMKAAYGTLEANLKAKEEKRAAGEDVGPEKTGVSRDSWYDDKEQVWDEYWKHNE